MKTQWMLILGSLTVVACADASTPAPTSEGTAIPLPSDEVDERADVMAQGHFFAVNPAADSKCDARTMIGSGDVLNTTAGNAVLTEIIGPDGCVEERWARDWDADSPLREEYDVFSEWLARNAYVDPYSYVHHWTYDADGNPIAENRVKDGESDPLYTEERVFDSEGRLLEHRTFGSTFSPNDVTHQETWTFGVLNDTEFETHTRLYDGAVSSITRRVFDASGLIIEEYHSRDGVTEHLVLAQEFDPAGRALTIDTFERHSGAALTHTVIERRADGTMLRKTEKNFAQGWFNVWEYDTAERQVRYTQDETEDGSVEYVKIDRYDGSGNLVFTSTEYGFDRPQTTYSDAQFAYDAQNRLVERFATPTWMRGESSRERRVYDAFGGGYVVVNDVLDASGRVTRTTTTQRWLDADRMAWQLSDHDRNGIEEVTLNRWDGPRQLETLHDGDGDGYIDSVTQWHYDAVGQLVEHIVDHDADHVADSRTLHAY